MDAKNVEKIVKGFGNHWRIKIILVLHKEPGLSLDQICGELEGHPVTLSIHISKMTNAGLVRKVYKGRTVQHYLTPLGNNIFTFLKIFK
jgi:DNA-binding transcriptional ArsR family regulator